MNVKIVYPAVDKKRIRSYEFRSWVRWLFFLIAYACPIINIASGGHAWSIVVIWSLRFIWSFTFSPDLVEYNRISQTASGHQIFLTSMTRPPMAASAIKMFWIGKSFR